MPEGDQGLSQETGKRVAVVLLNLGGPDSLDAVQPFLQNLFSDPAIIRAPGPIRALLARRISKKRAPLTREIYEQLGGKTPLLELTEAQAEALEAALNGPEQDGQKTAENGDIFKVFTAMRYWHPRAAEVVGAVKDWGPSQVVLLPLYPQYSTTTTASSVEEWKREAVQQKLIVETRYPCCYPADEAFLAAHRTRLEERLALVPEGAPFRVLFSAHGLPKMIVDAGDPYQFQVEETVRALMDVMGDRISDHTICYQSRVTPQEWIGPSTEEEIERAGKDGVGIVLVPIAFVSEHSETLIELDVEYKALAGKAGVPFYYRVPTLGVTSEFVRSLEGLVRDISRKSGSFSAFPPGGRRLCPAGSDGFGDCPCRFEGDAGEIPPAGEVRP